jgi:hypothetical protein
VAYPGCLLWQPAKQTKVWFETLRPALQHCEFLKMLSKFLPFQKHFVEGAADGQGDQTS